MYGNRGPVHPQPVAAPKGARGATAVRAEMFSKTYAVVALPGVVNYPPNYPTTAEKLMIKNDFVWMAENREKILGEWTKRYESKAAPKN